MKVHYRREIVSVIGGQVMEGPIQDTFDIRASTKSAEQILWSVLAFLLSESFDTREEFVVKHSDRYIIDHEADTVLVVTIPIVEVDGTHSQEALHAVIECAIDPNVFNGGGGARDAW